MLPFPDEARPEHLVVHTDGASRGNPGPSGAGALLSTRDGSVVREVVVPLRPTTNNVAEYEAVLAGLRAALEEGARTIELRADSQLLIRQLQGIYKVKAEHLQPLHEEARRLLGRFRKVELKHVPREENAGADALANRAIDGDAPGVLPATPDGLSDAAAAILEAALKLPPRERKLLVARLQRDGRG